jgi:hydrogenase maturation protease
MTDSPTIKLADLLVNIFRNANKLLLLGVGENRMGDDGIGPWLSFRLYQDLKLPRVKIINGGILPEQRLDEIVTFRPDVIILIDAIRAGYAPGSVGIYEQKELKNYLPVSSHTIPLPVFIDRIVSTLPQTHLYLLGIEPYRMDFEEAYHLFEEEIYGLDDYEQDPNIPFYRFCLTPQMQELGEKIKNIFQQTLLRHFSP